MLTENVERVSKRDIAPIAEATEAMHAARS